jgi:UDP-3-O-[3-hydroxymyristoyl] N-acetylglucosamine deacetylase
MNRWLRRSIQREAKLVGIGIHSGQSSHVWLRPAAFGEGWRIRPFGDPVQQVQVNLGCAEAVPGASRLVGATWKLSTVEHAFAALLGMGVTDVLIEFKGDEFPILDGSSEPWCEAIAAAGLVEGPALSPLVVEQEVRVQRGTTWASLEPGDGCRVAVSVEFEDAPWVSGTASLILDQGQFRERVAWARTFVLLAQARALREAGRGLGANRSNTVIVGPEGPINVLRRPDEVAHHKLLDAIGDLSLLGSPLQGLMRVHQGSHALHLLLLRQAALQHGW